MDGEETHMDETLAGGRSGGFTEPENYFEETERSIMSRTGQQGFTVPEGYFSGAAEQIMGKVRNQSSGRKPVVLYMRRNIMAVAASLLLVSGFFIYRGLTWQHRGQLAMAGMSELSDDEILHYMENADVQETDIADVAGKYEDNSQKQVEDYLINNVEEQQIIDEL